MEFFHFLRGFLSSELLGFYYTENIFLNTKKATDIIAIGGQIKMNPELPNDHRTVRG